MGQERLLSCEPLNARWPGSSQACQSPLTTPAHCRWPLALLFPQRFTIDLDAPPPSLPYLKVFITVAKYTEDQVYHFKRAIQ